MNEPVLEQPTNEQIINDLLAEFKPDLWKILTYARQMQFKDVGFLADILKEIHTAARFAPSGSVLIVVRDNKIVALKSQLTRGLNVELFEEFGK